MKHLITLCLFVLATSYITVSQADSNKRELSLKTKSGRIKIEAPDSEIEDAELAFSSEKSDTLYASVFLENNNSFKIYSDIDTVNFAVPIGHTVFLSVEKNEVKPIVITIKNGLDYDTISFDQTNAIQDLSIVYEDNQNNIYLNDLRSKYPIDSIASTGNSDLEKIRKISSWVHSLWQHDGWNEPEKGDALYILEEVKKGKRFRCVEYGVVTTACLNSIGIKARTLSLKTKDSETRQSGAGHVLLEAYLYDLKKWVVIDPQWDIIPHINGTPLNAVELQSAITNNKDVSIWTSEPITFSSYVAWIYPYLYYLSISLDNREYIDKNERYTYNGYSDLMLVPIGAKKPTIFQQLYPINNCIYTNSIKDFYSNP